MNPLSALGIFDPMIVVALPVLIFIVFVGLFIPSLMSAPSAKPEAIARSIACYILKGFGLLLIGVSLVPMLYNLLTASVLPHPVLLSIVLLFVVGVGTVVQAHRMLQMTDDASSAVSRAIFHHACEVFGSIVSLVAFLSLMLSIIVRENVQGWELPVSILMISTLLAFSFSLHRTAKKKVAKVVGSTAKKK